MASAPHTSTDAGAVILRLLARVRREARAWVWAESLAILSVAAAAMFWGSLAFDWLVEPPAWARGTIVAAATAVIAWLAATRLAGRLATRLPDHGLALVIERLQPHCGDAISTAVGLAEARTASDPDLAARTTITAAALAGRVSTRALFRRGRLAMVAAVGLLAAASIAALLVARPDVAAVWSRRMVMLDDVPWPRRVRLEAEGFVDGVRRVPRGGDVDLLVRATAAGRLPEVVELRSRTGGGAWQPVRMGTRGGIEAGSRTFGHRLEAVSTDLELEIRGGDARLRGLSLRAVEPPALASARIRCTLPDYLGGDRREPPASRVVAVPRGSRLDVTVVATKPLAAATLSAACADDPPAERAPSAAGRELASLTPADPPVDSISASIPALDADCTLAVSFTDTDGITNREPISLVFTAVPDEPPRVTARLSGISTMVTPAARLPIVGSLTDDHGLAAAAVAVSRGGEPLVVPLERVRGGELLVEFPPDAPAVVALEPLAAEVGDRVRVKLTARDGCGLATGPNVGEGGDWTLDVVTAEALQAMLEAREVLLRRRFEAAIDDLSQTRRTLDEPSPEGAGPPADRLAEATARTIGEGGEIAAAFRVIRDEFGNNGLLTAELETRLVTEIADPLAAAVAGPLTSLATACRDGDASAADLAPRADAAIAALRGVLARMLELESFNEVVERLRGVIEAQERLRRDTLERQRQRARELLE